ncbi:hypothetical protein B0H12DRAFT_1079530 [Mycena haematopus]|nr:hypothetical protein B0H12DRAFT_1079530 [Mycena haematopus]
MASVLRAAPVDGPHDVAAGNEDRTRCGEMPGSSAGLGRAAVSPDVVLGGAGAVRDCKCSKPRPAGSAKATGTLAPSTRTTAALHQTYSLRLQRRFRLPTTSRASMCTRSTLYDLRTLSHHVEPFATRVQDASSAWCASPTPTSADAVHLRPTPPPTPPSSRLDDGALGASQKSGARLRPTGSKARWASGQSLLLHSSAHAPLRFVDWMDRLGQKQPAAALRSPLRHSPLAPRCPTRTPALTGTRAAAADSVVW